MSPHELGIFGAVLGVSLARAWWAYTERQAAARALPPGRAARALLPPDPAGPAGWVDPRAKGCG